MTIPRPRPSQQYEEIAEYLRALIESGKLQPGDPLPSEAELCKTFDTSRGPVRQAVASLRNDGLISSGRGRRSLVLEAPKTNSFDALISATSLINEAHFIAGGQILRVAREQASPSIAEALNRAPNDPIVEIVRLRTANKVPVLIERLVFPFNIGKDFLDLTPDSESIHKQLLEDGVTIDNAVRSAIICKATAEQAELLEIAEGDPVWKLDMRASTFQGEHVEYAENVYRADMVKVEVSSVRGASIPLRFEITGAQE